MDILIHTLSGTTTAAFIATFSKANTKSKLLMVLLGGFAGALPDIDAISLWSKFDGTIGKWLHLNHSGNQIYFGKFWYSHHGFFHSLVAAAFFSFLFIFIRKILFNKEKWGAYFQASQTKFVFAIFFFSYISHLIGDLPTPGAVWGGIRLFFPFEAYVGGYGTTWWWNNYDVFFILALTTIAFIIMISLQERFFRKDLIVMATVFYIACITACTYFVTHHSISFAYSGNTSRYEYYERTSKMDQYKRIGKRLYFKIEYLDKKFPFYF
jgi:inner membrane protein